jgi:phage shock protein PspC (stress-responsive transcriptional regulator)
VGYTALTIFSTGFPGLLLYILMALMIPKGGKNDGFEDAEVVD